ncbi:hypothetical protein [Rhizobium sp. RAF56]|jgi:hypothetical protein|uniref:hypothetical protein n=1 Tax=Rhizobium sp. RAF56 TaxID=3233062 RepID=UPI003F9AD14A
MLFGQSIFQSVLDRLEAEKPEGEEEDKASSFRIRGLNSGFAAAVREGVSVAAARPDQAYVETFEVDEFAFAGTAASTGELPAVEEPVAAEPVMPQHLARTAPEEVAVELAITEADTVQTLNDKRRAFAKGNHPDGIALPFRDNATARMKIANLLIDQALRRLTPASRTTRRPK